MKLKVFLLTIVCLVGFGWLSAVPVVADDHHGKKQHARHDDRHTADSREKETEGNETAGQIAAWLLVAANLTVAGSILIKWTNRYAPLTPETRNRLAQFNRSQKKYLMPFHYWLNPAAMGIALWHWSSSRCAETSLPEWGLLAMVMLIGIGIALKFKLSPKPLKQRIMQIHTQPAVFLGLILMLTIGHMVAD